MRRLAVVLTLSACTTFAHAEEPAAPEAANAAEAAEERDPELVKLESSLRFKTGDVVVGNDLATLHLKNQQRFLGPDDTEKVLVAWGNPPGNKALGMVLPDQQSPFEESSWAVLVSYSEDGHVDDDDAKDIDFGELLTDMKK